MIYLNPQWQGSGFTDELYSGAFTLKGYFKDQSFAEIALSDESLERINNINGYKPILSQTLAFKNLIKRHQPIKTTTLGGDCGIDLMPVSWLNKVYQGDLCLIWIDAHGDINSPESSPSKNFHGMPVRTLLGEGDEKFVSALFSTLNTNQLLLVGMRSLDPPEEKFIKQKDILVSPLCSYERIKDKVSCFGNVYIHLDLDVLDILEFPHTRLASTKGFKIKDLFDLIISLKTHHHVVGFCITESIAVELNQLSGISKILDELVL